jgi:hypothetical protein
VNLSVRWKLIFELGLILVLFSPSVKAETPLATAPTSTTHHGDPKIQQKRLAFIKNVSSFGLIAGIDDKGPVTRVLAGQKFKALSFEEKDEILNIIWAYYKTKDPQKDVVLVIDQKSGKEIGEYSLAKGGLKMK